MFRPRVIALLLVLITLLAYLPALQNGFLSFDDATYVTENSMVQGGVTWSGVKWAFTTFYFSNWHPLTWIAYMVDYQMFRLNPAGHHLVSILIHSANVFLLFILLLRLTGDKWVGAFVAALFAWHPLRVESVAWVAELKDVLSTFFGLQALLCYVCHANSGGGRSPHTKLESRSQLAADDEVATGRLSGFYWLAVACFALSLMAKSMLVTLPFVMLLLDYWPLHRTRQVMRCLVEKLPFFLLAAGASVLTFLAQRATAMASLSDFSVWIRLENAVAAYAGYLGKAFWPAHLAVLYPLSPQVPGFGVAAGGLVLTVISTVALVFVRQHPWLLVGWLWYLGTLIPVIGLVQVGSQSMADRYTYFPLIGIFLMVTLSARELAGHFQLSKTWVAVPAVLVLIACLVRMECQLRYWRNTETLFTHALAITRNNPMAHLVMGDAYLDQHELQRALAEFQETLRLDSTGAKAYRGIGRILSEQGKPAQALEYFQTAVRLQPKSVNFHDSLGLNLIELGRLDEARREFSEAIIADPKYAPARYQMGRVLLKQGNGVEAVKYFKEALQLEPENLQMLIYVSWVLAADEDPQVRDGVAACDLAQRAVRLADDDSQSVALDTLAAAYAETGRFDEALTTEQKAIELDQANGSNDELTDRRQRLELYRKHQPWRKSFRKN